MTKDELSAYYRHLDNIVILRDNIFTERAEGRAEGKAESRTEGAINKSIEIARDMKNDGLPVEMITKYTGLPVSDIEKL